MWFHFHYRWNNKTSAVIPDEEVFYLVAFLSSAPNSSNHDSLDRALEMNEKVLDFCKRADIGMKQYLPYYSSEEEWKAHFGSRWKLFAQRKHFYDPLSILAPGQKIFRRAVYTSWKKIHSLHLLTSCTKVRQRHFWTYIQGISLTLDVQSNKKYICLRVKIMNCIYTCVKISFAHAYMTYFKIFCWYVVSLTTNWQSYTVRFFFTFWVCPYQT